MPENLIKKSDFKPSEKIFELFNLEPEKHGWERFGENHSDNVNSGYIEGPWMTKHQSKYYLQYAAPGTEFNVYGDGVYVGDSPLGPFTYAPNNPFSYKPGGFINGAGHGSTVKGPGRCLLALRFYGSKCKHRLGKAYWCISNIF